MKDTNKDKKVGTYFEIDEKKKSLIAKLVCM